MHSYRERNIAQAYATSNAALEFYFLNARLLYTFFGFRVFCVWLLLAVRMGIEMGLIPREWGGNGNNKSHSHTSDVD